MKLVISHFNPVTNKDGDRIPKKSVESIPLKYATDDFIKPNKKKLNNTHPKQFVYFATSHIYYNNSVHNHLKWLTYTWKKQESGETNVRRWGKDGVYVDSNPYDDTYMEEYYGRVWFWGNSQPIMWHGDLTEKLSSKFLNADAPLDVALFQCNYLYNHRSMLNINEHKQYYMKAFEQCRENNVEPVVFMHGERVIDGKFAQKDYNYLRNLWTDIANSGDALVIPYGLCIRNWYKKYPNISINNPWCNNHPNRLGTLLMTYTMFYIFYGIDPVGIDYTYFWDDIDSDSLLKVQTLARDSVDEFFA